MSEITLEGKLRNHRFWQIVAEMGSTWDFSRPVDEMYQEAAQLYARECCVSTLEKAAENVEASWYNDYPFGKIFDEIDKGSITDPDNIVLL